MKRVISGIQPSGVITIANYIGAIKNFVKLQNDNPDYEILVFIADLHAITVQQDKTTLRNNIKTLAALYVACGLDPKKVKLFIQSEISSHNQLGYIMQCNTVLGELERMTQYKDKKVKQTQGIGAGLLIYPSLMAADILLYDADFVPVGEDQKQHLELTRDLAIRFNNRYSETFVVPEPLIAKVGAKIMSLTSPERKMSKSDENPKGYISMLDDPNVIKNKIKGAVTDLDTKIIFDKENKPGISNLLTIYSCLTDISINDLEEKYKDSNYSSFKEDLVKVTLDTIIPIQERYKELIKSKELDDILDDGRDYANNLAYRKINKVYNKVGLGRKR
ncbi:MAG: tryptophan--tRNA ligase [bacterium]